MCIQLIDEAWMLEVKEIVLCPSFRSKLFLANFSLFFLIFFIWIYNEINKSHSWYETSTFAWMYIQV